MLFSRTKKKSYSYKVAFLPFQEHIFYLVDDEMGGAKKEEERVYELSLLKIICNVSHCE